MIRKHLVPSNVAKKYTYDGTNGKKYIIIHETDNTKKGADADAHSRLQYRGNSRKASWQYQIDDKEIVQSFLDTAKCWAAANKYYDENGIHIEICVNSDGDFKKAVELAIKLTKHLMDKYNIPLQNVIQHNKASGKNCPRNLRSGAKGVAWNDFINGLKDKPAPKPTPPKPKPVKPTKLKITGVLDKATITALQKYFNTTVDGYLSNPSLVIKALQRFLGTTVDGYISTPYSEMIAALQRRFGTTVDGYISKGYSLVIAELQRRLNKGKL